MSYLNVIPLTEAKTHLGVDDSSRDVEITRMIKSCLSKVESDTNHHVIDKDKTYILIDDCVIVYDYPINTTTPTDVEKTDKPLYSIYTDTANETLTLNVGHTDPANVPEGLRDMGLILLEQLFNRGELKETAEYTLLKTQFKRFII